MEEASCTADPLWNRRNRLWGQFDIKDVYVARGPRWEPIVKDGKLNLRYRANPKQWMEGLTFSPPSSRLFKNITWVMPFDLTGIKADTEEFNLFNNFKSSKNVHVPHLSTILAGLLARLSQLKLKSPKKMGNILTPEEKTNFQTDLEGLKNISVKESNIKKVPNT